MKKYLLLFVLLSVLHAPGVVQAATHTPLDLSSHNTQDDCWTSYDNKVYDLTEYVEDHDVYLDIRDWCGEDMTLDYDTKAGIDRDHSERADSMLSFYYIGDLELLDSSTSITEQVTEEIDHDDEYDVKTEGSEIKSPYNLPVPVFLSIFIYVGWYYLTKSKLAKENKHLSIHTFNLFWNTVMLLTLVIPSFGFGVIMIVRYRFPQLYDLDFNFLYWHVELSIVMGTVSLLHLIQRFKLYIAPLRLFRRS